MRVWIHRKSSERNQFSDFFDVGRRRYRRGRVGCELLHSTSLSFSIRSPTSIPPSAHAKEIRKLISLRGLSMNPDSHCSCDLENDRNENVKSYSWFRVQIYKVTVQVSVNSCCILKISKFERLVSIGWFEEFEINLLLSQLLLDPLHL